jgi:hypothetical protein
MMVIIIPLACGNQNNTPSTPISGEANTRTPTPTSTSAVFSPTPTFTPGGPTSTFTSTFTSTPTFAIATPVFDGNNGISSSANGTFYSGNGASGTLYIAANDGINPEVEEFTNTNGVLSYSTNSNFVVVTVNGSASTVLLVGPQGFAATTITVGIPTPTYFWAILDENTSGGATLYSGLSPFNAPSTCAAWGNNLFKSPKCLTADSIGNFYIADTGNGYVEQWYMNCYPSQLGYHRWNNYYDYQTGNSVTFVNPYAVACDPTAAANVFVGDAGVPNSRIIEFTSGGTSVVSNGIFSGVKNCIVQGLAVDASDNVYVSDSFNHQVEEYGLVGGVWSLLRTWSIPVGTSVGTGYIEYYPFNPSSICLTGSNIFVGDYTNQLVDVFGP